MDPKPTFSALLRGCFDREETPDDHASPEQPAPSPVTPGTLFFSSPSEAGRRLLRAFSVTLAYRALVYHLTQFGGQLAAECCASGHAVPVEALAARLGAWLCAALEWGEHAWPYSVYTPGANPNYSPPLPALIQRRARPPGAQPPLSPAPTSLPSLDSIVLRHIGPAYTRVIPMRCVAASAHPDLPFLAQQLPMLPVPSLCTPRGARGLREQLELGFPHPATAAAMVAIRCEHLRQSAPRIRLRTLRDRRSLREGAEGLKEEPRPVDREASVPTRWLPALGAEEWGLELERSGSSSSSSSSISISSGSLALDAVRYGFFSPRRATEANPFDASDRASPTSTGSSSASGSPTSPPSSPTPSAGAASPLPTSRPAPASPATAMPSPAAIAAAGAAAHRILWGAPDQAAAAEWAAAAGHPASGHEATLCPGQGLPMEVMDALRGHLEELLYASTPALAQALFEKAPLAGCEREADPSAAGTAASEPPQRPQPPQQIHVPPSVTHPLTSALAVASLRDACSPTACPTPALKLAALLQASQVLDRAIRLGSGGASSADDLLPAQVWALLAGCPAGFHRVLGVLECLLREQGTGGGGQSAYVLTTWRVAAAHIARECAALPQ